MVSNKLQDWKDAYRIPLKENTNERTRHLEVGERAFVGAKTGLHRDVKAGSRVFGYPQREEWVWQRTSAALSRLPGLIKRVRDLERKLGLRVSERGHEPDDGE